MQACKSAKPGHESETDDGVVVEGKFKMTSKVTQSSSQGRNLGAEER